MTHIAHRHPADRHTPGPHPPEAKPAGPQSRRSVLSAGAAGAGALALAGCGAAEDVVGAASSAASAAASSAARDAISKATVPVGGGKIFPDAKVVVTQPEEGQFKAFSAVCTHQGCVVSDVSGGAIVCGCHGSAFDIATGEVLKGPATRPLPGRSVSVGADGITVG